MAELREHANRLQQENERLQARLETNGVENPQGIAQPVPLTRADKGKGPPYLTTVIIQQMTNSPRIAPRFPIVHHLRIMWKPNPRRDLLASPVGLLVLHITECEKRPVEIGSVQNWPRNIYLPGSRAWPPNFRMSNTRLVHLLPFMQHFIPLSGGRMTCCLPSWASIFWTMSLLTDLSFHRLLCTTAPLIHMIICCTLTRQ